MWIAVLFLAGIMSLAPVAVLAQESMMQPRNEREHYLIERINSLEATVRWLEAKNKAEEEEEEVEVRKPRAEDQLEFEETYNIDDGESE